eukprot:3191578-Pleurochrysis_carterae.AAC.1
MAAGGGARRHADGAAVLAGAGAERAMESCARVACADGGAVLRASAAVDEVGFVGGALRLGQGADCGA